ncbi:MAG TPA: transposase domain-containing protein [Longimicrobiales bacterium]
MTNRGVDQVRAAVLVGLPGLPGSASGISKWLRRHGIVPLVNGGGPHAHRYSVSELLPHLGPEAVLELEQRIGQERDDSTGLDQARMRLLHADRASRERINRIVGILVEVESLTARGHGITDAISEVSERYGVAPSTVHAWRRRVRDLPRRDWEAALCHAAAGTQRPRYTQENPFFATFFARYWGNQKQPPLSTAYRRMMRDLNNGRLTLPADTKIPSESTVRRILRRDIRAGTIVLAREGPKAHRLAQLHRERDRSKLHAYEIVTGDGHTADWLIEWEDGRKGRPEIITLVDEFSGFVLGYEIDHFENSGAVRRCAGSMIRKYGLPDELRFDNGSGFIAKELTAGSENRYRGKEREGELPGVFVKHGIKVRFFVPERPTSKGRHERSFGPLEDELRADPDLPPAAYVGSAPDRRPEQGGTEAVPIDVFRAAVARAVEGMNQRPSRGANCGGRSPAETFQASYGKRIDITWISAIDAARFLMLSRKATPSHDTFAIQLFHNTYYDEHVAAEIRRRTTPLNRKVIIYYDPGPRGLHRSGIWVHDAEDRLIGWMPCVEKTGYRDVGDARETERERRAQRKADREQNERIKRLAAVAPASVLARDPDLAAKVQRTKTDASREPSRDEKQARRIAAWREALKKSKEAKPRKRTAASGG